MGQKVISGDLNVTGAIKHNGSEISYEGAVYTAGTGISISSNAISVNSTVAMKTDLPVGTEALNFNDSSTTATSATLNNIVLGNNSDGYTRYEISEQSIYGGIANASKLLAIDNSGFGTLTNALPIITTAPSSANSNGVIICVLSSEPATKYSGYLYLITGSN